LTPVEEFADRRSLSVDDRQQRRGAGDVVGSPCLQRQLLEGLYGRLVHTPGVAEHAGQAFLLFGGEDPQQVERLASAEDQGQFEEQFASFHLGLLSAGGVQQPNARGGVQGRRVSGVDC
jgi:hypothetical protein